MFVLPEATNTISPARWVSKYLHTYIDVRIVNTMRIPCRIPNHKMSLELPAWGPGWYRPWPLTHAISTLRIPPRWQGYKVHSRWSLPQEYNHYVLPAITCAGYRWLGTVWLVAWVLGGPQNGVECWGKSMAGISIIDSGSAWVYRGHMVAVYWGFGGVRPGVGVIHVDRVVYSTCRFDRSNFSQSLDIVSVRKRALN